MYIFDKIPSASQVYSQFVEFVESASSAANPELALTAADYLKCKCH